MTPPSPLPYYSPDPNPRVPWRAWVFLLIAWVVFALPSALLNLGPDLRRVGLTVQRAEDILHPVSLKTAVFTVLLGQAAIVISSAFLARHAVRALKSKLGGFVRITATAAIIVGAAVLLGTACVAFLL